MKINLSNHKRIYLTLDSANKGAKVRTLNWNALLQYSYDCEHRLASASIAVKDRIGARAVVGYEKFPNAYYKHGSPFGTIATLERGKSAWFLVGVSRTSCDGRNKLYLTDRQKEIIAKKAIEQFD